MATLSELVYDLWEAVEIEIQDDSVLDRRNLEFLIHKQRALWLRNELNKNRTVDEAIKQTISNIQLTDVTSDSGFAKKTSSRIPATIERHNNSCITKVYPSIYKTAKSINFVDYSLIPYTGNGRFNIDEVFATLISDEIYLVSNKTIPYSQINVEGVFNDPTEVETFDDTKEYPLQLWMWNYIKAEILKTDLPMLLKSLRQVEPKQSKSEEKDNS
jgi:hypothetical protein